MDTSGSTVAEERLDAAERLARPMGILGFLFLFIVLGQHRKCGGKRCGKSGG